MKKRNLRYYIWQITKYLLTTINFIAAIASIIGLILTLDGAFNFTFEEMCWIFLIIIFIALFWGLVLFLRSERSVEVVNNIKYAKYFHKILHSLRNSFQKINKSKYTTYKDVDNFLDKIILSMIELTNTISNLLSKITGKKVRCCIKLMDYFSAQTTEVSDMNLITFARNGNEVEECKNEQSDPIKINDNTDFESIFQINETYVKNRKHYFYQPDLKKYAEELRKNGKIYKNSNPNWQNEYNATIVLPIRYLESSSNKIANYKIIGFLCVDSESNKAFNNKNELFIIDFLKGIADILYSYLFNCIECYQKISGVKEEEHASRN